MASLTGPAGLTHESGALAESIWQAPLVPVALAFTAGVAVDRLAKPPFAFLLLAGLTSLLAFAIFRIRRPERLGLVYLALAGVALAAAYHHFRQDLYADDDIGHLVSDTPRLVTVRGTIDDEPRRMPAAKFEPLRTQPTPASATTTLSVERLTEAGWERAVSGRIRLFATADAKQANARLLDGLHPGDEVEVTGRLGPFGSRANPGEFDLAAYWHHRGVHAILTLRQGDAGVKRLRVGWPWSPQGWLGVVRGAGHDALDRALPDERLAALARALLLGEGAPMTSEEWSKYVRTGVVHVLAISGQHLVVVACFLWFASRALGVRQRHTAILVAVVLLAYALITGGRPPAMRAAVGACAVCLGLVIGRPAVPANLFALGWVIVGLLKPSDLFEQGCQLSFVAVAILCWGAAWILHRQPDPLQNLVERARTLPERALRHVAHLMFESYAVCLIVWVAITPLAAHHSGLVTPAALLLGPPLTLLTSVALLAGFILLMLAPIAPWAAVVPAWFVRASLGGCEFFVDLAERWPVHLYVGEVPAWMALIFYLGLFAVLTQPYLRLRWRLAVPGGLAWLCLTLLLGASPRLADELRCTFLAVGHGGAVVLELPDGRTVLYDAGSLRGPDVGARTIAPFLWSRRVERLDDVILSHADLDHFNGLVGLAERFTIGRVLTSASFEDKNNAAVRHTLAELERRRIRRETLQAGDRLAAAGVTIEVLHPPAGFTGSNENTRSLVLQVLHRDHSILLTGDLEKEGLYRLIGTPPRPTDVLQAPHHGSASVDGGALVRWCMPNLVVSCQGAPRGVKSAEAMYRRDGVEYWTTHARGAVTVRSGKHGLTAEAYLDDKRWQRRPR
jgi:competence protein ComEC